MTVAAILGHPIKRPMLTWGQVLTSLILERLEVEKFSKSEIMIILETNVDEVGGTIHLYLSFCVCVSIWWVDDHPCFN